MTEKPTLTIDAQSEQETSDLLAVSNAKSKNERLSFKRKYDRMQETIKNEIKPLEETILTVLEKKAQAMDRLEDQRRALVKECVHPREHLVHKGDHVLCKFCNCNLSIPK